jgi:hypothetical protein
MKSRQHLIWLTRFKMELDVNYLLSLWRKLPKIYENVYLVIRILLVLVMWWVLGDVWGYVALFWSVSLNLTQLGFPVGNQA